MILRALALCLLTALPVTAQDFRGLRPGMDASVLGAIGEPLELYSSQDGTQATYPLPHGHRLLVDYSPTGTIGFVASFAGPDAGPVPQSDGLRVGVMSLRDVLRRLGRPSEILSTRGLVYVEPLSESRFSLVFDIGDDAASTLILDFNADPASNRHASAEDRLDELGNAVFTAASLVLREGLTELRHPDLFPDGPRTAPIPFPLSIDEAFPSLIP
ncbi:hypothetical protein [Gymnodinialimonas hymeniacidonis]|uniref:hypothetical protein n=1 Tax=Gymnodinialimonas hymeniacidonis TaxID=3126508 RepID=UPI0034C60752